MLIRFATEADIPAICEIENAEIDSSFANFGLDPVSAQAAMNQFLLAQGRHPWVTAEEDGSVVGFARASAWKSRGAYAWTAEVGVYVKQELRARGIGKLLYAQLFPAMERAGLRTIVAGIALPNPGSVKLHESFGMKHSGTLPSMGFKHGEWRDVGYWMVHLGAGPPNPC